MEYPAVNANNTQFRKGDKYIWGVYIFLIIVSVIELYSASSREVTASNVLAPIMRHGFMLLLGFGVVVGLSRYSRYHRAEKERLLGTHEGESTGSTQQQEQITYFQKIQAVRDVRAACSCIGYHFSKREKKEDI